MNEKEQLMNRLTSVSFAMDDVILFLDTHPNCREALEYYNKCREMREEIVKLYETKYGPIRRYNVIGTECWKWIDEPWPWEGGSC